MNYCSRAKIRNRQTLVPRAISVYKYLGYLYKKKKKIYYDRNRLGKDY